MGHDKHVYESSDSTKGGEFLSEFGDDHFLKYGLISLGSKIVMGLE
jgi:hypothetical protein